MKEITKVEYNFHLSGNISNGCGEDYHVVELGKKDTKRTLEVKSIQKLRNKLGDMIHIEVTYIDNSIIEIYHPSVITYSNLKKV